MGYGIGVFVMLAVAANAATDFPREWTLYTTPPPAELGFRTPAPAVNGSKLVIIGHRPIYGYLRPIRQPVGFLRDVVSIAQPTADWNFECPRAFGYYKYDERSCDYYIECRNNIATFKVCPDGTHFKRNPRWSEYPCAHPPEAECASDLYAQPPKRTADCERQFGFFRITRPSTPNEECLRYVSCSAGVPHIMDCASGLVFNPKINQCDWPENVPECRGVFSFRCPSVRIGEEDLVYNYRDPNDSGCRYFYSCQNGNFRLLSCDEGLLFDHRVGRCVEYDDYALQCTKLTGIEGPW